MGKGHGVSSHTHTQAQLNNYANQHNPNNGAYVSNVGNISNMSNPNNDAYQSKVDNRSNQLNPNNSEFKK